MSTMAKNIHSSTTHHHAIYYIILNISPAWYAAVMGIGISGALLYEFPYNTKWLEVCGILFWACAMGLFVLTTVLLVLRMIFFPKQFLAMIKHVGQSSFLGCAPMGFATIINMTHFIWGDKAWRAVYVMWWIDVLLSLLSAWILVFIMFAYQERATVHTVNATILLPVVALVVAASTGALISNSLPAHLQTSTAVVSLMLWANGEAVAFAFTTIYMYRMLVGKLPASQIVISNFLPVGPLGQGAFAIMNLCELDIIDKYGEIYAQIGTIMAICMLGYASFWLFVAFAALLTHRPKQFHMSFWGLTFPLGTYVSACYKVGDKFLPAFKPIGCFFCVVVIICVLVCTVFSLIKLPLLLSQVADETGGEDLKRIKTSGNDSDSICTV